MIIDLFLVALLSFVCFVPTDCSSLVTRQRRSAADLTGSEAFSGKLLRSHILLDPCTINCVAVVVVLPDELVRLFRQDFQSC